MPGVSLAVVSSPAVGQMFEAVLANEGRDDIMIASGVVRAAG
jgi:hypothetical protein